MAKTTLTLDVTYDDQVTDTEALASAADRLMETVLSTPGIMEEYANPRFGEFFVARSATNPPPARPNVVVEVSGTEKALEAAGMDVLAAHDDSVQELHRWVLYDLDSASLPSTRVYTDYAGPSTTPPRQTTFSCCRW